MATNKVVGEGQKLDSCRPPDEGEVPVHVKIIQVQCGAPKTETSSGPATDSPAVLVHPAASSTGPAPGPGPAPSPGPGPQTSSTSVMAAPGPAAANGQPEVSKAAGGQVVSMNQNAGPGRTVVITVPRVAAPQPVVVAPRPPQTTSTQAPANIQVPAGMMLIRSDSGQLMLVSQQALVQAQQGSRPGAGRLAQILTSQVSAAAAGKSSEKVTVIRMAAPPSFQPASVQKTAMVKVIGVAPKSAVVQTLSAVADRGSQPRFQTITGTKKEPAATFSEETLESVKKCKNFLVTLIKLASSDSRSANMANNVRGLVRSLLEGKVEAEEFTEQLYKELKSTPQPCLVPFLKKSLPAVRRLTADPQLFIQQASSATCSSTVKQFNTNTGQTLKAGTQVMQLSRGVPVRSGLTMLAQNRTFITKNRRLTPRYIVEQTGKHTGSVSVAQPSAQDPLRSKFTFKDNSGSYKEDDDINDVASMAGVNLREENAQILTSTVGSVVQSCQDQLFLSPNPLLSRILHTGQPLGVTDVAPDVVALISHATQECLRGILEKLSVMAAHRKAALKEDLCYTKVSDVRAQLRFLEEVETLKKKRKDEEERERLLRLARSRSEDPLQQQLKQRAKELQLLEEAELQQKEANLAALAAIGPRRKRPVDQMESQVSVVSRPGVPRVTRLMLRDLLVLMEQQTFLRHSLTLYRAMI